MKNQMIRVTFVVWSILCSMVTAQDFGFRLVNLTSVPTASLQAQGIPLINGVASKSASALVQFSFPAPVPMDLLQTGDTTKLATISTDVPQNAYTSVIAFGSSVVSRLSVARWDKKLPQVGNVRLRVFHGTPTVTSPVAVTINSNLFFNSVSQYNLSSYIEIVPTQALRFDIKNANQTSTTFGAFLGKLEAGNTYTICIVPSSTGEMEVYALQESNAEEQKPLAKFSPIGQTHTFRYINLSSDADMNLAVGKNQEITSASAFSASRVTSFFNEDSLLTFSLQRKGAFVTSATVNWFKNGDRAVYAIPTLQTTAILAASYLPAYTGKNSLVRVLHAGATRPEDITVSVGATTFNPTSFFSFSNELEVQSGSSVVVVKRAGVVLTEVPISLVAKSTYTLVVFPVQQSAQVRVFEESNVDAQTPLLLLQEAQIPPRLRFVNASENIGNVSVELGFGNIIYSGINSLGVSEVSTNVSPLSYVFTVFDPNNPTPPIINFPGNISNGQNAICFVSGTTSNTIGGIFSHPINSKPASGFSFVRIVHAGFEVPATTVRSVKNGTIIANGLMFGQNSTYASVATDEASLDVVAGNDTYRIKYAIADYPFSTIFLLPKNGSISAYLLADYDDKQQTLLPLSTAKISTNVAEEITQQDEIYVSPQPASEKLRLVVPENTQSECEIFSILGVRMWSASLQRECEITTSTWEPGMYIVRVRNAQGVQTLPCIVRH